MDRRARDQYGRPLVPDAQIERARKVTITEAWGVLRNEGYHHQYEGNWLCTHPPVLTGRALTAMYMPRRPSIRTLMEEKGEKAGVGDQISWPIDMLVQGDVYVADVYTSANRAGAGHRRQPGDSIYAKSGDEQLLPFVIWTAFRRSAASPALCAAGIPPMLRPRSC